MGTVGNAVPVAPGAHRGQPRCWNASGPRASRAVPAVTLMGNGELVAEAVTPVGDGAPRVVLDFPNVKSLVPADVFVGRGPVSAVHVKTTGTVPTTRVTVDLAAPGDLSRDAAGRRREGLHDTFRRVRSRPPRTGRGASLVASLDPIDASLMRGGLGAARRRTPWVRRVQ